MAVVLAISPARENPLPQLEILGHQVVQIGFDASQLVSAPRHDITLLDCRTDLANAKAMARILLAASWSKPLVLVVTEASLAAVNADWGLTDFIFDSASLGEVDVRIRLASTLSQKTIEQAENNSGLSIDETSYTAKISGRTLDLTFKEFELLRYLNENPNRVFTREQLLSEVWGYDYFGGTRTVDVHVRRLRAKLGEHESLIGTVRNVGYRLDPQGHGSE
ncbi:MAG: response regulator transcription factor [Aquiluna sp.]|nr:response regulator transcription factor [Aquiluna sp.]